jgi:fructosamine-3-kinase
MTPDALTRAGIAGIVAGDAAAAARWETLPEGTFNAISRLVAGSKAWFVKTGPLACRRMFAGEAQGLRILARAGALRVPGVVAAGETGETAYLVLEWLDIASGGRGRTLGEGLARLHGHTAPRFGFEADNTIGSTLQRNSWRDDWAEFFRDCRLAPQLALAAAAGHRRLVDMGERLLASTPALLRGHRPRPALLHGDLWAGNAGELRSGEAAVYDPAAYYGDREADLAMTELFGGFEPDFHAAYRAASPLDEAGYAIRRELYNLYHVLNHLHLFGGGYARQAEGMIARLLAHVR